MQVGVETILAVGVAGVGALGNKDFTHVHGRPDAPTCRTPVLASTNMSAALDAGDLKAPVQSGIDVLGDVLFNARPPTLS